ncbi:MAG: hypothetical protein ACRCTD_10120 [Beijerinckiaceae bacterium]
MFGLWIAAAMLLGLVVVIVYMLADVLRLARGKPRVTRARS